jgi:WD repeat-containing protein 35
MNIIIFYKTKSVNEQRAEIELFFGDYKSSAKIYSDMNRLDLVLSSHIRTGNWFGALELIDLSKSRSEKLAQKVYHEIGGYYYDRSSWTEAISYFEKSQTDLNKLAMCYIQTENFESLFQMIDVFPIGDEILKSVAQSFSLVGMTLEAVTSYIKYGDIKAALDLCLQFNQVIFDIFSKLIVVGYRSSDSN